MDWARNRGLLAKGCWGVAGVPIVATFVQAIIALTGVSAFEVPVIGTLTSLLQTIPVLDAAAVVFRNSPSAVLLLFVLVLAGWVAEGVAAFVLRARTLTYGAAGFVTLFFALFLLVYSPLFSADVPAGQLAAFVLVPVVASAASWGAALANEWAVTLDDETAEVLTAATERAQKAQDSFDATVRSRADERARERVASVAPGADDDFESRLDAFRTDCTDVLEEADALRESESELDSRERLQRARQLRTTAQSLDPEAAADEAVDAFRDALTDAVRDEFGDLHVVSPYNEAYEVRNFREYNELRFPALERTAQIGGRQHDLAEQLVAAIDGDAALSDVARAVETARDHLDDLEAAVDREEAAFVDVADEVDDRLETVGELTDSLAGQAGDRLSEFLVEGRFDDADLPSVVAVEAALTDARADLHACRFDDARSRAERAREDAERLVAVAEFFANSVVATVEQQVESVPLPPDVPPEFAASMDFAFEETFGVEYAVDGETITLAYDGELDTGDRGSPRSESATNGPLPSTDRTDANVDDVIYLLREVRDAASTASSDDTVSLQTGQVPEQYTTEVVLNAVESVASRHTDVETVSIPSNAPPGFIEVTVGSAVSPRSVLDELYDEYVGAQQSS